MQAHLQDFLRLGFREAVESVAAHAKRLLQAVGTIVVGIDHATVGARAGEHLSHELAVPWSSHQFRLRHRRRWRLADDADELVDIGQRHGQAFQHVAALARLAQVEHGAACHDLAPVLQKNLDEILQVAQAGLAVHQGHHIDAEGVLQLCLLVQVVEHDLWHFATLEFDHQAHARLVRLVLNVADALDLLLVNELGDAFLQGLLVHLVGQLVDDDGLALAAINVFEVAFGAHHHAPTPGAIAILHAIDAIDDAGCGEIRRRNDLHQFVNGRVRTLEQMEAGVDHLVEVVRWDVGGHTHRDAGRTVDEQIGQPRRQHQGLFLRPIVVRAEIDGFLVDVGQHLVRDLRQSDFGIAHGCRVIAIDRAKIALAIHQHVSQREILGHAHDGVVHRTVAVRVVLADHIAHDTGRLLVRSVPVVVEFVHRKQHAPMHWLEAIARVGQGASHDHAHRIVEVAAPHFLFKTDGQGLFGELCHVRRLWCVDGPEGNRRF